MPYDLEVSQAELLSNPDAAIFRAVTDMLTHRQSLASGGKGKTLAVGDYRGVVTEVTRDSVHLKSSEGVVKKMPLTSGRARQLMAADTTRK
tara:strand:+ start:2638 stop:2910 length:273 start_codon:yes stop_codon:yes gene_type:complete